MSAPLTSSASPAAGGSPLLDALHAAVGVEAVTIDAPLAPLTTFHVGGPADVLVQAARADELVAIAQIARAHGVPLTVLGGGSNVLIGDRGVRGIVVLARDREVTQIDAHGVRAAAGLTINGLVRWTIGRGLAGLEAWAGTPGTVGGAIHGNAHFQGRLIGDLVREVRVLLSHGIVKPPHPPAPSPPGTSGGEGVAAGTTRPGASGGEGVAAGTTRPGASGSDGVAAGTGTTPPGSDGVGEELVRDLPASEMAFGYDTSRLQGSGEIVLSAVFDVTAGEPDALRRIARESLAFRKRTQPLDVPSAGCIFQNPDPARERVPEGIPPSAGALIDRAGLKGQGIGGARVSSTHGNFVVHDGRATAADIRGLIDRCKQTVAARFGVTLREEIVYLGEF